MIVDLARGTEGGGGARYQMNIQANTPSPLVSRSGVQKGGRIFGSLWVKCCPTPLHHGEFQTAVKLVCV